MREELVARNVDQPVRRTAWIAGQARVFLRAATEDPGIPRLRAGPGLRAPPRRDRSAASGTTSTSPEGARSSAPAWCASTADSCAARSKSAAGVRALPLVSLTRAALLAARDRQADQRSAAGMLEYVTDWQETGNVFTTRSGRPVQPRNLSRSFDRIVAATGLPKHRVPRPAPHRGHDAQSLGVPCT